jgi:hypothetical protein
LSYGHDSRSSHGHEQQGYSQDSRPKQ